MNERTKSYEKITRKELNEMAKKKGMKYTRRYNRFELAEKLGIELSKLKPRQGKSRKARPVEILNSDGTTTIFNEILTEKEEREKLSLSVIILYLLPIYYENWKSLDIWRKIDV